MGDVVTQDMEKVEILNNFFALSSPTGVPTTLSELQKTKAGTGRRGICYRKPSGLRPSKKPKGAQVHRTDEIHLQALREPVDEIA